MRHSDSRFNIWITDRFDYVYENLEVETFMPDYNTLNDLQNDVIEEAIDAIEVMEDWQECPNSTFRFNLKTVE